jgi:hypothetical protein
MQSRGKESEGTLKKAYMHYGKVEGYTALALRVKL